MKIFIISWSGQHKNAELIARNISQFSNDISIVYSDPDPEFIFNDPVFNLIRRPNELFWEDKFKACLDHTDSNGMLVIHADCLCDDWSFLVTRCIKATKSKDFIGVWAPKIDGKYWNLQTCGIFEIQNTDLVASAIIDAIVFYLCPEIISRMRQINFGRNKFGWGIGGLFCAASYVNKKLIVIDRAVEVIHPQGRRGYDEQEATKQMHGFLHQFSPIERLQHHLLVTHVNYINMMIRTKRSD